MSSAAKYGMRFDHYVGFVCPPGSNDYTAQQFKDQCDDSVSVMQTIPYFPDATYDDDLGNGARRLEHLKQGIQTLKDAKVELVIQFGGYWSLAYAPTYDAAIKVQSELAEEFGLPITLNWIAIADALHEVGAKRISVAAGYYRKPWTDATVRFLESAGFDVAWAGDIVDQSIVADDEERVAIETATRWDYPDDIVHRACVDAAKRVPDCDAVCQTGGGMRTTYVVEAVESEIGKPLVATDIALFWATMKQAGIRGQTGCGRLISSTRN